MFAYFVTFLGGETAKKCFSSYEEAQGWFLANAGIVIGVSEIVC